jgi:hypothetical protein
LILNRDAEFNFDGCCLKFDWSCFHNYFVARLFSSNRPFRCPGLERFPQKFGSVAFDGSIGAWLLVGSECSVGTWELRAHSCSEEEFYFSLSALQSELSTLNWKPIDYVRTGFGQFPITFTVVLIDSLPSSDWQSTVPHESAFHLGSPYRCHWLNNPGPTTGFCLRLLKNFALKLILDKAIRWSGFGWRLSRCLD